MWWYDSIQFKEFNPIILMWTQHRINIEKLNFLTREKNNISTEEDVLAICISLINMVNAFANLQIDFIFSIWNYYKKKRYTKYFAFADKWQKKSC